MTLLLKRYIALFLRRVLARHYWLVTALSVILSALAVWGIATQWNINSDFKALLPTSSAAYQAMEEVGTRVGSGSALFVVIDSPDTEANKRFAEVFARELRELPDVALAHFHNDKSFFNDRKLLYLETEDLEKLHERIEKKIQDAKREANPFFVSLGSTDDDEELLNVEELKKKYSSLTHNAYKEYLISDDGYSLTIVVRFVESSTDLAATNALITRVEELGKSLKPASFHPEMTIDYGGGLINRQAEYSSILSDIKTSAWTTILGLFLVIALYFRRMRAVLFVLTPLIMGVLWTLALSFLVFGQLTTVATFIFAVLLGLGIDYSIHFLNEYDIYRRRGVEPVEALVECFGTTGKATVVGAVTTTVTFVVLAFAQFRGLSQFGQVASIGIVCTLVAMMVVLPAMILSVHSILPYHPPVDGKAASASILSPAYWFDERKARPLAPIFVGLGVLLCVLAGLQLPNMSFEENFRKIGEVSLPWQDDDAAKLKTEQTRVKKLAKRAAHAATDAALVVREAIEPETYKPPREQMSVGDKYTSALGGMRSSTPTLLLFDDAAQTRRVYEYMAELHKNGELDTVRSVASIYSFMPGTLAEQKARMKVIDEIRTLLQDDDLSFLDDEDQKRVDDLRELVDVEPFTIHDLPLWSKRLFKEAGDGAKAPAAGEKFAYEYLIYVNEAIDAMKGAEARRFLGQVQQVKERTEVDFRVGSQSYIYTAMLDQIKTDGLRMMGIALGVVLLILTLTFGNPLRAVYTLLPVLLGMFWMIGVAAFIGLKLDFFNVIIIPVLIGAGVDDGVHFYCHYLKEGRGSVGSVMKSLGGALVMTTITSAIGFAGLAVTDYDGLQSIGYMAVIGMSMALLATLLVLPPILWLAEKYDIRWLAAD
jgi:predicted RND superfamily exporter protein